MESSIERSTEQRESLFLEVKSNRRGPQCSKQYTLVLVPLSRSFTVTRFTLNIVYVYFKVRKYFEKGIITTQVYIYHYTSKYVHMIEGIKTLDLVYHTVIYSYIQIPVAMHSALNNAFIIILFV